MRIAAELELSKQITITIAVTFLCWTTWQLDEGFIYIGMNLIEGRR